jgi:7-cyano-7-deazaguanine reductase
LVGIPRYLNRTQYGIKEDTLPFSGFDTWNCYEFSTLLDNGFPLSGVIRITYSSVSPNIVESKSLKLYLNSFNMHKSGMSVLHATSNVISKIKADLSTAIGQDVQVSFRDNNSATVDPFGRMQFLTLEDILNVEDITFDNYKEDSNILKVWDSHSHSTQCIYLLQKQ